MISINIGDLLFGQRGRRVIDVEYEDLTPPQEPTEEIIEDWTSGNPNKKS